MMAFIKGFSHDKKRNLKGYERLPSIVFEWDLIAFIELELFHYNWMNLNVYERFPFILLAMSRDDIYWMCALPR
jgi:hypothetical protein